MPRGLANVDGSRWRNYAQQLLNTRAGLVEVDWQMVALAVKQTIRPVV